MFNANIEYLTTLANFILLNINQLRQKTAIIYSIKSTHIIECIFELNAYGNFIKNNSNHNRLSNGKIEVQMKYFLFFLLATVADVKILSTFEASEKWQSGRMRWS